MLARGWLRQAESDDITLFTHNNLTPRAYQQWLQDRGVTYVALADTRLDYLASDEAALIRAGLPYLRPIWSNDDWRLYRVQGAVGLVSPARRPARSADPDARMTSVGPASFSLAARRAGSFLVRVHYTPYWTVIKGNACVGRDGDWTRVGVAGPGTVTVSARLTISGLLRNDGGC